MIEMGAKGYVTKNSSKEEMLLAIREALQGKTYICKEVIDKMSKPK
jgi:DNA-binding NarL/FixJ family response regulator